MKFNFRIPIYSAVGCLVAVIALELSSLYDLGEILFLVTAPFVVLALLVIVVVKRNSSALATLAIYCGVLLLVLKFSYDLRIHCRWLISSGRHRAEVRAQPQPPKGGLQHAKWDGWGFAGAGYTYVYIVFDPSDSLSRIVKENLPGEARGIPCKISRIDRLESDWYSVVFDTDAMWPSGKNTC